MNYLVFLPKLCLLIVWGICLIPDPLSLTAGSGNGGVSGRIWTDVDYDGIQDDPVAEPGYPGLKLDLVYAGADGVFGEGDDDQVMEILTDENGVYNYSGLVAGQYRLKLNRLPENYMLTPADQGTDEMLDSDGKPFAGFTISGPGDQKQVDFGIALAPNIEASLVVVGVDFPPSDICGRFTLILESEIHNTGSTTLQKIQAAIDLASPDAFGAAYTGLAQLPELLPRSQAQSLPVLDAAFDGDGEDLIFDGESGLLAPGEFVALRFAIEAAPENAGAPAAPQAVLEALGLAVNANGLELPDYQEGAAPLLASDLSNHNPVLDGTYDDGDLPTPLSDCWKSAKDLAANAQVNVPVNGDCAVNLTAEMLLANPSPACSRNALPQGGYYRLFRGDTEITGPADVGHLIGQTLEFQVKSVVDPCTPVSGTFLFEDKRPPVVECPEDLYLICSDLDSVLSNPATLDPESRLFTGLPVIRDNCSEVKNFTWSDQLLFFGCPLGEVKNGDGQSHYAAILRTFKATDAEGNVSAGCKQIIYLDRPPFQEPPAELQLDICREEIPLDEQGHPHPDRTGYPFFVNGFGDTIRLSAFHCNYAAAYQDQYFDGPCNGAYKVIRRWTVSDWCGAEGTRSFEQVIEVGDFSPPAVLCPPQGTDTLTYSTGPFNCTAAFLIPEPEVSAECSAYSVEAAVYTYRRPTDPFGNPYGDPEFVRLEVPVTNGAVSGVPVGTHYLVYTVRDECGNAIDSDPCVFKVADRVEPVAICGDNLNVSIGGSGLGRLIPPDIDRGSRDNCGTVQRLLRRRLEEHCLEDFLLSFVGVSFSDLEASGDVFLYEDRPVLYLENGAYYTPWGEDVFLTCCDSGASVQVELQAADGAGNRNTCSVTVTVEDKILPQCLPPADQEVACSTLAGADLQDTAFLQSRFGRGMAMDNCTAVSRELSPLLELDECGAGTVTRRFQALDAAGNQSGICRQEITVRQVNDYLLRFPADAESENCERLTADTLLYETGACDLLAVSVEESTFEGDGEACFKIFRTYRVINWCAYDGISDPIVIGRNEDQDGGAGEDAVFVIRTPEGSTFIDSNDNPADGYLREADGRGFWQYTQIINLKDRKAPLVTVEPPEPFCSWGSPGDCDGAAEVRFTVTDSCSATGMQVRVDFDEGADGRIDRELTAGDAVRIDGSQYTVNGQFPLGAHRLVVRATDGCGNLAVREIPLEIVDCKPPAPVCTTELTLELMPVDTDDDGAPDTAFTVLHVNDLIPSETPADCSGEVRYSINRTGRTPNVEQSSIVLSCPDADAPVSVELYVWDAADNPYALQPDSTMGGSNYDFCTILVHVQDNQARCTGPAAIAGQIATEEGDFLKGVTVQLNGQMTMAHTTGSDGDFHFAALEPGYDYSVAPALNTDPGNGVSTLDLVKISKHILGVEYLDSPYKVIAADANGSGSVSTLDMIQLRKLILGLIPQIPGSPSWRFIDRNQTFADSLDPWRDGLLEIVNFNDLREPVTDADFVAVKLGDVNGSAAVDNLAQMTPRSRGLPPFPIRANDRLLEAGTEVPVSFTADELHRIQGMQFTLQWDAHFVEAKAVEAGVLQASNFGFFPKRSILTASWHPADGAPPNSKQASLFTLRLKVVRRAYLSDVLRLHVHPTAAEAYNLRDEVLPLEMQFHQGDLHDTPVLLYQNRPNPFRERTLIPFKLPAPMFVTIAVSDAAGRILFVQNGNFQEGYNEIPVSRRQLGAPGLLFCTIKAGPYTASRSMILLD